MRSLALLAVCLLSMVGAAPSARAGVLIAVSSGRGLYEIHPATGVSHRIGTVSDNVHTPSALAYDRATGTVYLASSGLDDSLYTLNVATGEATLVGSFGSASFTMHGLEFADANRTLYGGDQGTLYRLNTTTGAATPVGPSAGPGFLRLGYNSHSDTMYAIYGNVLHTQDLHTGVRTPIGPLAGPTMPAALAYHTANGKMYLHDNIQDALYTVNLSTGAATLVGPTIQGENLLGLAYIPAPGPTIVLGAGAAAWFRRTTRPSRGPITSRPPRSSAPVGS